ncbi:hypothetical protein ACFL2V_11365 [Pseudomonadota bacterium]
MINLLEGLFVLPLRIIVVSENEPEDLGDHPKGRITWVSREDGRNSPKIKEYLLASDMTLTFDDSLDEIPSVMDHGSVVIAHSDSPFMENYHPNDETGNGFTFDSYNPWDIFRAVVRATETYRFPYDWGNIVRAIVKSS